MCVQDIPRMFFLIWDHLWWDEALWSISRSVSGSIVSGVLVSAEANQESGECELWLCDTSHRTKPEKSDSERKQDNFPTSISLKYSKDDAKRYLHVPLLWHGTESAPECSCSLFSALPDVNSSSSDQWSIVRSPATPEMVLASAGYYRNPGHVTHSAVRPLIRQGSHNKASHWSIPGSQISELRVKVCIQVASILEKVLTVLLNIFP